MDLLSKIKDLSKKNNITLHRLEIECSLGRQSIEKWDKSFPSADKVKKIADYFNVSVDYLLGREEKENPSTEAEGIAQRLSEIINNKYSKDELKSITDDDLNLISDIFIDTVKNVKKYKK